MASVEENHHFWNNVYDWSRYQGDEWSARWGGPDAQWFFSILPRLERFLPARSALEIGPGQGRFTAYLKDRCQHLILLDVSERCIQACRQRFRDEHLEFRIGDGRSLPGIEPMSLDFVFSFESLVHAEADVMGAYLQAIAEALKPGGAAFLHHSNLGQHLDYFRRTDWLPKPWRRPLKRAGWLDFGEWRAHSMTADRFVQLCPPGLHCSHQELVPWGGKRLIDCFSTVIKTDSPGPPARLENTRFIARAYAIQRLARLYCADVPW